LVSATALVVASMIGVGVFTTSGFSLGALKSPAVVLAAWAVGGVLSTLGALSYGALARRLPESGGEYLFMARTLHPVAGTVAGWISLLVGFSAPLALAAFGFGEYLKLWFPGWPPQLIGTVVVLAFTLIHASHVQGGAWIQNAAVAVKVVLLTAFAGLAATRLHPAPAPPVTDFSFPAFGISLMWISFSYSGWNAAIYVGGEVRDPERNLPRALLLGTGLVTALYLALNAVFVFAAPVAELANKPEIGQVAARALGGEAWAHAITTLVALGLLTSVSSLIMAGPRVSAQMARDRCLPRWLDTAGGPPRMAIVLQSALALLMLWSSTFENLLTVVGFTLSLCTAATVLGLIRLRLREGPRFPVPGWPWVPGLFLLGVLIMAVLAVIERTWPAIQKLLGGS
jgi:APA family basic amino acid/polyamine antiporter